MAINRKLLPIKGHYFFFMAAMGPILPQLQVYGKELGISSVVMGTVTGILPLLFMLSKPLFGIVIDVYRDYRKLLFMGVIFSAGLFYSLLYFIPTRAPETFAPNENFCEHLDICSANITNPNNCQNVKRYFCSPNITTSSEISIITYDMDEMVEICSTGNITHSCDSSATYRCKEEIELQLPCLYKTYFFWAFIVLMSLGTIAFNVSNSVSDAICFDVIGTEHDYGKQRVWGTIGFGVTALLSGLIVNFYSDSGISYTPALIVMMTCVIVDLFACNQLDLPVMHQPENIFKDMLRLLKNLHTKVFIVFAVFAGVVDGFIVYFLFWFLEDLTEMTNTGNIKLIEGLVVAAETLGGEVIFFSIAGKIIARFGHAKCFSMCFIFYALRLACISVAPNPWWVVLIEFFLQGPTYALTYTTIVAYANAIAPPGASATMQGIAAGMDDGFGYAIGSFLGGISYSYLGKSQTFQLFAAISLLCGIMHVLLQETVLKQKLTPQEAKQMQYKSPDDAIKTTNGIA